MIIKKFEEFRGLKKIYEIFDDFNIKSMNELEYIVKGKEDFLKDFKEIEHLYDENTLKFFNRLINDFPVLKLFNLDEYIDEQVNALVVFATSIEPIDDKHHYGNLFIYYDDNKYHMASVFRELENVRDKTRWIISQKASENYDDARKYVNNFLDMCLYYNIITDDMRNNPSYN
jgi:hypothetical protein